ncbi:hypothetical protein ACFPN1_01655 [Lysobacter yangpyeongensis]|uniref:Uncharacterized protein n=1 Tax=Lysobacter yangpyeongensis TaxID=346182 RepID=A0ABW0SIK7_9GAMM
MATHDIPHTDDVLLNAVLRVVHDEGAHGREWRELEPALAATWERMRSPAAPRWEDVADRVRDCCRDLRTPH